MVSSQTKSWISRIASDLGEEEIQSIAIDTEGSIFVGGHFTQTAGFFEPDNTLKESKSTVARGGFVAKYTSRGLVSWVTTLDGQADDLIVSLASTSNGDVYAGCNYQSSQLNIMDSSDQITVINQPTSTIVKFDRDGIYRWSVVFEGIQAEISSIASDSEDNVLVVGSFRSTQLNVLQFPNTGTFSITGHSSGIRSSGFLVKINLDGVVIWTARALSTVTSAGGSVTFDQVTSVRNNEVVITSKFTGNIAIYGSGDASSRFIGVGTVVGCCYAKFRSTGYVDTSAGLTGLVTFDRVIANEDGVFLLGNSAAATATIYNSNYQPAGSLNSGGVQPFGGFLMKFNINGLYEWTRRLSATHWNPRQLLIDRSGIITVSGYFKDSSLVLEEGLFRIAGIPNVEVGVVIQFRADMSVAWYLSVSNSNGQRTTIMGSSNSVSRGILIAGGGSSTLEIRNSTSTTVITFPSQSGDDFAFLANYDPSTLVRSTRTTRTTVSTVDNEDQRSENRSKIAVTNGMSVPFTIFLVIVSGVVLIIPPIYITVHIRRNKKLPWDRKYKKRVETKSQSRIPLNPSVNAYY